MRKWKSFFIDSLKGKSFVIFFLLVFVPMTAIGTMFYYQTKNILEQQAVEATFQNLNSTESNLTTVVQEIEDLSEYIIFSDEFYRFMTLPPDTQAGSEELYRLRDNISGFFTFHLTDKDYFNSLRLEGENGQLLEIGEPMRGDESFWKERAISQQGKIVWSTPYTMESNWENQKKKVITLFRVINDIYDINQPIGNVSIRLDQQELYKYVTQGYTSEQHNILFIHSNGEVYSQQDENGSLAHSEKLKEEISRDGGRTFQYTFEGKTFNGAYRHIEWLDLKVVSMVSEEYIQEEISGILTTFQWMILAAVFIVILAVGGFILTTVRPVMELTQETKRVEEGDFTARVKVRSNDELGQLGYRFNKMVKQIQHLIETKYKLELQNKESQLKTLQNQINPHFLYNTLDMIRWTARLEKAPETGKSIEDLSRLFRLSLNQGKIWVPLKDEIKYVQSYLELQKRRLGDTLRFLVVMEAGLEKSFVMKLILQPLAENSIKHGFEQEQTEKSIYIRAYKSNSCLYIDAIDNGKGINAERVNAMLAIPIQEYKEESFALRNIHERIRNAFGNEYGLEVIEENHCQGAFIRLRLPLVKGDEELRLLLERKEEEDGH